MDASTIACSRQLPIPATIASRDSLAPCRKNSSAIAASASIPNAVAHRPVAGSSDAAATVPISHNRNGSTDGKDKRRMMRS